jgi:hypothetical protein
MGKKRVSNKLVKRNIKSKEGDMQTKIAPVRGDTISFWSSEGGFRYALVLAAQDREATILTSDNDRITLPFEDLNEVHDNRMELLRTLPDDEAVNHREDYLEKWIVKCQERADQAAIARGAPVDEHGRVLRNKPGRKQSDEKAQRISYMRDEFIRLVEESDQPVTKKHLGDLIPASIYADVINAAIETSKVEKNGTKRGTNYTIPGRTYEIVVEDKTPTVDADVMNVIVKFISENGPTSKAELISHFGLSPAEWTSVRYVLQNEGRVNIEGERRGTRYVGK